MNFDCDFQIGHEHAFIGCQDYCLVGEDRGKAYACLSDGCSSSQDVDIGSRVLCLSARENIIAQEEDISYLQLSPALEELERYGRFAKNVIGRADEMYNHFPNMSRGALDATLLSLQVKDKKGKVYIYGDGIFVHKNADRLLAVKVEVSTNAPDYLSYTLDIDRINKYTKLNDEKGGVKRVLIVKRYADGSVQQDEQILRPFDSVMFEEDAAEGDIFAVISDGANSFRKPDDTAISWLTIIDEFVGFKNMTGVFVKRRLNAFKKKCAKEGVTHSDDISVASIVV